MGGPVGRRMICAFCGQGPSNGVRFIQGQGETYICANCVTASYDLLRGAETPGPGRPIVAVPKPHEIVALLDRWVVGQVAAKKALAVAAYNHSKRIGHPLTSLTIAKSNVLLIGPTGSGKTLLAQTLAHILGVPFAIVDATPLTQAGYVGDDVENILLRLLQAADYDVAAAERGIIYLDELDKIVRKDPNPSITRDVSGEGVQQALLKILEGTVANVPLTGGRKHPQQDVVQVNTRDILFIAGGTFEGLDVIIAARQGRHAVGFKAGAAAPSVDPTITAADLRQAGLLPELVGRLPVVVRLDPLSQGDLVRVLTEPADSLVRQYQAILAMDGCDLEITPDALAALADRAAQSGTGARGLRALLERILLDVMYEVPGRGDATRCIIDAAVVQGTEAPTFVYASVPRTAQRAQRAS